MKFVSELIAEANLVVETITAADAIQLLDSPEIIFIDLREDCELQREGKIPGAIHSARGMLEFVIDPTTSDHVPAFSSGRKLMFYCASGGRSVLAAYTALNMGLTQVAHLEGGIRAWKVAGGPIEIIGTQ
jgi:rhodanese-related sulfurtransferase